MIFEDIVGQAHIATTLRNAITTNRLSHAYIFSGPRGVGKTTAARILAKAINCEHPDDTNPDNKCDICAEITEGRSVNVFEIDGASNRGVDEIRNLREAVRYGPAKGKYKIYIIDEVHMLTKEAFNALLKTLEEPPSYVMFIFATTEIHKVPLTILSRCQRFDFRRISIDEIISRLRFISKAEKIKIDEDALLLIAKRADGSMRDAQSIFDQVVSFCGTGVKAEQIVSMLNIVDQEIFFRVTEIIKSKDIKAGLLLAEEIIVRGYDLREFLSGLMDHLRNILIAIATKSTKLIETSEVHKKRYEQSAADFAENDILRLIKIANDTDTSIRWSQQPRLKLEIGLVQMIKLDGTVEINRLLSQIDDLTKSVKGKSGSSPSLQFEPSANGNTDAPIKGSVKATPPTLRPDQIVRPSITLSESPSSSQNSEPPRILASEDILNKWSVFVNETRKERIALGTMLSETSVVEIRDDRLCIGCPDDFHLDSLNLKKNRQFLQDLAQKVYGAKIQLDTIISQQVLSKSVASSDKLQPVNEIRSASLQKHPVVQALIREFGAKPINR